jgi:hypothetical protein
MTSDLVPLTRLDVSFSSDGESYFQRTSTRPQPGMRHIAQDVRWQWKYKHLGGGTFGQVYLDKCMEMGRTEEKPAVKVIKKIGPIDYKRELEALAVLSFRKEVCSSFYDGPANH